MNEKTVIVGARKSLLAVTQTQQVITVLKSFFPEHIFELRTISTSGDKSMNPAALFDHQGIFVKEIEEALLRGEIDIAVHSLKDMPCVIREGLALGAVSAREDPRDAFISRDGLGLLGVKSSSRIGTSSVRRRAQILYTRPDLQVCELRGNVDTRLEKLDAGEVDALVMACAGLVRLGLQARLAERIPFDLMLPAPCQGALALEIRSGDTRLEAIVCKLDHSATRAGVTSERSFLKNLGGGCSLPVGAFAEIYNGQLMLIGEVVSVDGKNKLRRIRQGHPAEAETLGELLARDLLTSDGNWIKETLRSPYPKNLDNL